MKKFWINHIGKSMFPLIQSGDQILIEKADINTCTTGDIILYYDLESKELILHRLIELSWVTKGDFSLISEKIIPEACIGKALAYKRNNQCRIFPKTKSAYNYFYLLFSKWRMKGWLLRKISFLGLKFLTITFEIQSEKTTLNHNEMPLVVDLL